MRTLIFEGIATSGKSTIITRLNNELAVHKTVKVVPEAETLMKIVGNTDKSVSIAYLTEVIKDTYRNNYDMVLFDRLHLTHIFRTRSSMADYEIIEDLLRPYVPETIFLEVDEAAVADRVAKASEHRDPKWKDYIYTKGATINKIADYYTRQQRNQLKILRESTLPYRIFNTTAHDYDTIIQAIVNDIEIPTTS